MQDNVRVAIITLFTLDSKNKVWFSKTDNPKRKLKYTLQMIEIKKKLVIFL